MAAHNERGSKSEQIARRYLVDHGHRVLHFNWFYGKKELDIITEYGNKLIITEVKGINDRYLSDPSDLLSSWKMRNIVDAAEAYIEQFGIDREIQFDLIVVIFDEYGHRIEHLESAIVPGVNW